MSETDAMSWADAVRLAEQNVAHDIEHLVVERDAAEERAEAADRAIARLVARADAAEAERDLADAVTERQWVLLQWHKREADALRAQVEAAAWLIRTEHRLGHHDHHAANLACKGCAWLEDYDLSSSEPVTAGPEVEYVGYAEYAAGEVTPPAEQRACGCGHVWEMHGPEVPGCVECRCRTLRDGAPAERLARQWAAFNELRELSDEIEGDQP